MNNKISIACKLWKVLFEAAMTSINPDKTGYDKLFKYFDAYVEFEELIFASDSFYRDHTLHCIWVYLLGEYLKLKVRCIGNLPTNKNTYCLEIARNHADVLINGESQNISKYLKATQFYTKEEYAK